MSQESKTPRTDAEASDAANYAPIEKGWYVHVDFACQLERELAAVTEERDALIASARIREANSGWRPIETAPKDGTVIWSVEPGEYSGLSVPHQHMMMWDRSRGWIDVCEGLVSLPTHWMPLPAPPTAEPEQ